MTTLINGGRFASKVVNFRDLAETARAAGFALRRGLLFRSGRLTSIDRTTATLLYERGLRRYVDLRSAPEIERDGAPESLIASGVAWLSLPITEARNQLGRNPLPRDYAASYLRMLDVVQPALTGLVRLLLESDMAATCIACTAGKDRTGVMCALLLLALGVSDEAISADFARSGDELLLNVDLFEDHWRRKGITREQYGERLRTPPETMLSFLEAARIRFGGTEQLLMRVGLPPDWRIQLRARLLETSGTD